MLDRDLGRQNNFHGRAQALWTPNNDINVLLKVEGVDENSEIGVGKMQPARGGIARVVIPAGG